MSHDHDHDHHAHDGGHGHGHENDQGLAGALRYLRMAPRMWSSTVNDSVVREIAPREGEVVVDIGAGMGAGAVPAARSGAEIVAVEPTPFMRRVLKTRTLRRRNVSVRDGSAEHLPVADGGADAVFAVNTMHHWIDAEAGAAEVARVLRPGGRLLLVDEDFEDPTHPEHDKWSDKHGSDHAHGDDEGHHHGFTMVDATQMATWLKAAGLTDIEAGRRDIAGRPTIAIWARAAE